MEGEYIICAAIHLDDGQKHEHQPKNIETGFVIGGRRHHNCINTVSIMSKYCNFVKERMRKLCDQEHQGFLTSKDRYVSRKEAYEIALFQGQTIEKPKGVLFSEDLY